MRVECGEVEFASDKKQDRSHGFEARVATRLALGGLKQAVDGFDEAVGLSGLSPRNNAVEVSTNQPCDVLHRFDFRTHDVGAPLSGVLPEQRLEVSQLRKVQFAGVLEQRPAQSF